MEGSGRERVEARSGVLGQQELTWKARGQRTTRGGRTSPEDLIAAAHASCFAMALSHGARAGGDAGGAS